MWQFGSNESKFFGECTPSILSSLASVLHPKSLRRTDTVAAYFFWGMWISDGEWGRATTYLICHCAASSRTITLYCWIIQDVASSQVTGESSIFFTLLSQFMIYFARAVIDHASQYTPKAITCKNLIWCEMEWGKVPMDILYTWMFHSLSH